MIINSVRLQNIRTHLDSSYEFSDGVNILIGPNACGKTTILESIALSAYGSLPSSSKVKDMYTHNTDWQRIDVDFDKQITSVKVRGQVKEYEVHGDTKKRLSRTDIKPVVWFDPEALRLLRGSPERRRAYFDRLLSSMNAQYASCLARYKRSLQQRNSLLKRGSYAEQDVFVWDLRLAENADVIVNSRRELLDIINKQINQTYKDLSGALKNISLRYESTITSKNYTNSLLAELKANHVRDQHLGFTSSGPHRDDFVFYDEDTSTKLSATASRGEIRTTLLALKVIEVELLYKTFQTKPIILFDDVFSELDGARRKAFTKSLNGYQTLITTTDADIVSKDFASSANIIAV